MTKVYKLTHDMLKQVLDFNSATGIFVWKVARSNRVKIGSRAGVLHRPSGGRYISIDNEKFMAHRLAWFYEHARWPNTDVRPLDGNYDNCAIENLKEVSRVELAHRRDKNVNNESGYLGVSRSKFGRWQASITWDYKQIALGANFETPEDASQTYNDAAEALKSATSGNVSEIIDGVRMRRRQLTAWKYLHRSHADHVWSSLDEFAATVTVFPRNRYAMVPVDLNRPMGPTNFAWSLPVDATVSTRDGIVAYNRANREANRNFHRSKDFQKNYGIDFAEYQRMLVAQKGVCAICEQPETKLEQGTIRLLSVDHDHATKAVRGLLCANCNMAIGYACDSPDVLLKAVAYLRKRDKTNVLPFEPSVVNGTLGFGA